MGQNPSSGRFVNDQYPIFGKILDKSPLSNDVVCPVLLNEVVRLIVLKGKYFQAEARNYGHT
jgi:hypothetical protein